MNILNKFTIRNLKLNKRRTIVTIIGILLSTALICAVAGMVTSFRETLINHAIVESGNRHITINDVKPEDLTYFKNNEHVKSMYLIDNLGYAKIDGNETTKPYVYIEGFTKEAFLNTTIKLIKGRLPETSKEIVVPKNYLGANPVKIGDYISFDVGTRVCVGTNDKLNQYNPSGEDQCEEEIINTKKMEYKVVGISENLYFIEPFSAPGYTLVTYTDEVKTSIDVSLLFKNPKYVLEYENNLANSNTLNYGTTKNNELLRWLGVSMSDNTIEMITSVAAVVIAIIIVTSIFVIKNSFDISIVEKTQNYGMLSSIGATSKQIKKNVLYEGLILGIIGIPLGILCGIFADFILVQIINILGSYILGDIKFAFKVPFLAILLSVILSSLTIYLSVVRIAKKTSKITPLCAIRNNYDIKIKNSKLKTPKIIDKLFGVGGNIAYKNLKRSKKKYRTTVISIVVSVSVFIALTTFISYGFKLTSFYYTNYNYDISLIINDVDMKDYENILKNDLVNDYLLEKEILMEYDAKTYLKEEVYKLRYDYLDKEENQYIVVTSIGDEKFKELLKANKIEYDNNIGLLLDKEIIYENDKYKEYNVIDTDKNKSMVIEKDDKKITIDNIKRITKLPMHMTSNSYGQVVLIVSDSLFNSINLDNRKRLYIKTDDSIALEKDIEDYILEKTNYGKYTINNIAEIARTEKSIIILVSIFLYGFIIVISLIGITNIFNTITTNIYSRKREFAMLKSIGMTNKEFNKMIRLESIFFSLKSLLIGIPLGIIGSLLIYKAFATGAELPYELPIIGIIISIIAVILLVFIIMNTSLKKIRKQNIIETIRNTNI